MGRVEGKVAIITGGAGGLGAATARLLFGEGATVVVTDRDEKGAKTTASTIDPANTRTHYIQHDVTDESAWADVIEQTLSKFGRLDILVNNAGIAVPENVEEETYEGWRRTQSINLDGVFLGTKAAITAMKTSGGGSIVNLASIEGLVGEPSLAAYNASKGGVRIFSKSAALHCAKSGTGIRVNTVCPGYIWTPMVEEVTNASEDPEAMRAALIDMHPIGRLGVPDDVAYAILYLASDESSFVTGSDLVVDGGYTAQ